MRQEVSDVGWVEISEEIYTEAANELSRSYITISEAALLTYLQLRAYLNDLCGCPAYL